MRPVIRNPNPSYQIPTEIKIGDGSVRKFFDALGFTKRTPTLYDTPPILAWMAYATEVNKGADKWKNLQTHYQKLMKQGASAVKAIIYLIDNVFTKGTNTAYGNARLSLIENYGQYCSYCGMPVYDSSLAVEHMLPKASFPDVMMCYPNFLLACPICNSIKGEQPSYNQAVDWWKKTKPLNPNPTYQQIREAGLYYAILADNAANGINIYAYKAFLLSLWYYGTPDDEIPEAYAYDLKNSWVNTNNNEVSASIWNGSKMVSFQVFTDYVGSNPYPPPDAFTEQRADHTIEITGLDRTDPGNEKMTDRRNINRTVAFFEALMAFNRLQNVFAAIGAGDTYNALYFQVATSARLSGFYEVWINVFNYLTLKGSKIPGFYGSFKADTCDSSKSYAYFPGTDASRLP